ncbi:MAG: MBL fold metallo-hydrolase [Candidatus Lokiarchaeota archaeon]|nr:MBL fold metallo-hydrolase [Candidatus Lokiarchaeota archaeon]
MIKADIALISNNRVSPFNEIADKDVLNFINVNRTFITRSLAEHGLGFLINVYNAKEEKARSDIERFFTFCFDLGSVNQTFLYNTNIRGDKLENIDGIALSHWHFDHTGVIYPLLEKIKKQIPVFCDESAKKERFFKRSFEVQLEDYNGKKREEIQPLIDSQKAVSQPPIDINRIDQTGSKLVFTRKKQEIFKSDSFNITLSGQIPRVHELENSKEFLLNNNGILEIDNIIDDKCIIIEKEDNAIVLLGCCHSGIMNTLDYAKGSTDKLINLVIGGFHMATASDERFKETMEYLFSFQEDNNPLYLFPIHCTGERFLFEMKKRSNKFVKVNDASAGTVFKI